MIQKTWNEGNRKEDSSGLMISCSLRINIGKERRFQFCIWSYWLRFSRTSLSFNRFVSVQNLGKAPLSRDVIPQAWVRLRPLITVRTNKCQSKIKNKVNNHHQNPCLSYDVKNHFPEYETTLYITLTDSNFKYYQNTYVYVCIYISLSQVKSKLYYACNNE